MIMPLFIKAILHVSTINDGNNFSLYVFFLPPYSPQMNRIEDEMVIISSVTSLQAEFLRMNMKSATAIIEGIENRARARSVSS